MRNFDEFRLEQIEEQIERLASASAEESSGARVIQALQSFYARDAAMLEQVWQRLESHQTGQKALQALSSEEKKRENITSMKHTLFDDSQEHALDAPQHTQKKRPILGLFGTLAAVLVCVLLVGSLLLVFGALRQQHQTKTASHGPGHAPASPQHTTLLPTPRARGNAAGLYVTDSDTLYRLDPLTGKMLWSYSLPGDPNAKGDPTFMAYTFATGNGVVYVGEGGGGNPDETNLYAFDATTGQKLWTLHLNVEALAFANGTLYAVVNDAITAINPNTGATIWQDTQLGYVGEIVAIDHGVIYGFTSSDGQDSFKLFALRASNGRQIWTKTVSGLQVMPQGVTFANGVLYVAGSSAQPGSLLQSAPNYVQAYNASNGQRLWQSQPLSGLVGAAPATAGGKVYIGTNQGHLYTLNGSNGQINWQLQPGGDVSGPAYVANNTLYVAPITSVTSDTVTSQIKAYDATTGAFKWSRTAPNLSASDTAGAAGGMGGGRFIVTASIIYYLDFSPSMQMLDTATGSPLPDAHTQLLHGYGLAFMFLTH